MTKVRLTRKGAVCFGLASSPPGMLSVLCACLIILSSSLFFPNCSRTPPTLFQSLPASATGIDFINTVEENDSINVLDYMNIYTGAGVAAGDVDNDGLMDLFFCGNRLSSRLYLNKGRLSFEDITERAQVTTLRWCTGVTMTDINQDGWLDIYVCVSGNADHASTANLLFVNQGKDASGQVTFAEQAAEYGIAETRLTMNASFLDYDLDGDLDLFLITNPADQLVSNVNNVIEQKLNGEGKGTDILYRNDNGHFSDVSRSAGITKDGYSLGASVSDFNQDGYPDIYVSNDFISSDILYLNNGNGTFTDRIGDCLKHSSFASMGTDAADINNDGLTDIFTLDMLPEDHYRRKMLIPPVNIDKFEMALGRGYLPQYTRNTLQLNLGSAEPGASDNSVSACRFSEIALLAGISATDWSWAPLFADFDLDGDKDLLVTNGFYRDLGNLDYINYQFSQRSPMGTEHSKRSKKLADIMALESVPLQDYLFENNGNLQFTKRSDDWGFTEKGFSNGACFVDLDNDGDLEIAINQFNSTAKIYNNTLRNAQSNPSGTTPNNFLRIQLIGNAPNRQSIGAKIWLHTPDGTIQMQELNPTRGYESSVDPRLLFGMKNNTRADSVVVHWPEGKRQVEKNLSANQTVLIQADAVNASAQNLALTPALFAQSTLKTPEISHTENYFIDFKNQMLLPLQHSKSGPAIAVGDVNADGLDDFYLSAAKDSRGVLLVQKSDGSFFQQNITPTTLADETAACFFDADGDGDLDLYLGKGGSEYQEGSAELQDELWLNNGTGNFHWSKNALPDTKNVASCVVVSDFDRDGDLDLFVGGSIKPGEYPMSPRSILLKNEGGTFTDATPELLRNIGMVTDALWVDLDQNGFDDLVLAGEFMPLTILKNEGGKIKEPAAVIPGSEGWWTALAAADFDQDGDLDLVGGNLGLNSRYKTSTEAPLSIFAGDFDKNGAIDPIICHFEAGKRYIFPTRDELASQIPAMKKRFPNYRTFAKNTFDDSFRTDELKEAREWKTYCFESSYFENMGNGSFKRCALPIPAQISPIQDFLIADFNRDGHTDLLCAGNFYGSEYSTGRYDAGVGCLFLGDGKGGFSFLENRISGFWADFDARDLAIIRLKNGKNAVLIGNNNHKMQVYIWN